MRNTNLRDLKRDKGRTIELKLQIIREHLLESYNSILNLGKTELTDKNICIIINLHKKYIDKMNIYGRNKYRTLRLLQQYQLAKNKSMAIMVLANTLNKLSVFQEN
jgi:hypothetical protein